MKRNTFSLGFTLIELLIVVAIIAILAAIAIPNMLEAQTRAKVARTKTDVKAQITALNAYKVDHNQIPVVDRLTRNAQNQITSTAFATWMIAYQTAAIPNFPGRYPGTKLTTPVAYITRIPPDYFNTRAIRSAGGQTNSWSDHWGRKVEVGTVITWVPMGAGDGMRQWIYGKRAKGLAMVDFMKTSNFNAMIESTGPDLSWWDFQGNNSQQDCNPFFYDPTNGTVSRGQIVHLDTVGVISPR